MDNPQEKSCDNCSKLNDPTRYGCPWRYEIAMFEDKSPCLNYLERARLKEKK